MPRINLGTLCVLRRISSKHLLYQGNSLNNMKMIQMMDHEFSFKKLEKSMGYRRLNLVLMIQPTHMRNHVQLYCREVTSKKATNRVMTEEKRKMTEQDCHWFVSELKWEQLCLVVTRNTKHQHLIKYLKHELFLRS